MTTKNKSTSSSPDANAVTPLGLAVAALIICLLASLAVPRLKAVSAERARPEPPRILSAYDSPRLPAVMSDSGFVGWGGAISIVP